MTLLQPPAKFLSPSEQMNLVFRLPVTTSFRAVRLDGFGNWFCSYLEVVDARNRTLSLPDGATTFPIG